LIDPVLDRLFFYLEWEVKTLSLGKGYFCVAILTGVEAKHITAGLTASEFIIKSCNLTLPTSDLSGVPAYGYLIMVSYVYESELAPPTSLIFYSIVFSSFN
jgi:hypothetical protein